MPAEKQPYMCPVCRAMELAKVRPCPEVDLELDYCPQCGGMWFEPGESTLLKQCHPNTINASITPSEEAYKMECHTCGKSMARDAATCPSCGAPNVVNCPVCIEPLNSVTKDQLKLDVCDRKHGVWFDSTELASLWNSKLKRSARRGEVKSGGGASWSDDFFIFGGYHFSWEVDLVGRGVVSLFTNPLRAAGAVVDAAGDALESIPDIAGATVDGVAGVAGAVAEGVGDTAGAAVEGVGDLAGSIFEAAPDATGAAVEGVGAVAGGAVEVIPEFTGDVAGALFEGIGVMLVGIFDS